MSSKMLIDASHPEETRVVVLKGNRVEEFDFESANKKQLRGNIYLAKVTRVEPSLQAAFIEYGGNRHGFLAFSEIHPDYYQIPYADRQALLEEEARAHREDEDDTRGGESRGDESRAGESRGGEKSARTDRGGRTERGDRNERGHRRSRRHRRDGNVSALDRRNRSDESVSEAVGDFEPLTEAIGFDGDGQVAGVAADAASEAEILQAAADAETGAAVPSDPAEPEAEAPASAPLMPDIAAPAEPELAAAAEPPARDSEAASMLAPASGSAEAVEPAGQADAFAAPEALPPDAVEASTPVISAMADEADASAGGEDASIGEDVEDRQPSSEGEGVLEASDMPPPRPVEQIGGDALEETAPRVVRPRRHYKIQEVIKRRQILLIQVVKEERGNKGAALTTYLSLAGRYSVLMPNTARGGGISRKITDGEDRKRLKAIAAELDVPEGMGVILRTAGAARSNQEVKRDFEYLLRMWESVRELTLKSTAPTLVYEEGSLIKRSIRDLYSRDVEDVVVAGEDGFTEARDFMRMLMPGNANAVQLYRDPQPIFAKSGVEAQLDAMFSNHVTLKSGGYLVINQTEALVAIDVNSGRSTREHNIEDTALRTNLEAADEVARQLRLRDLAGLIVVDFIDMDEGRNNRAVERRIKDALKNDRARIQIGHISHFGLMEMSRQRIRTGVLEGSTVVCPHCAGSGSVRSTASIALHVLRLLEDALIRDDSHDLIVRSRTEVALYMLNQKRSKLVELERRFGVSITVTADSTLTGMVYHAIERGELATAVAVPAPRPDLVRVDSIAPIFEPEGDDDEAEAADGDEEAEADGALASADDGEGGKRRRRRRRRRGRDREAGSGISAEAPQPSDDGMATMAEIGGDMPAGGTEPEQPTAPVVEAPSAGAAILPFGAELPQADQEESADMTAESVDASGAGPVEEAPVPVDEVAEPAPRRRRSRRAVDTSEDASETKPAADDEPSPARRRRRPSRARATEPGADEAAPAASSPVEADAVARPSADRDVGANTVEHHPPLAASQEPAAAASPQPTAELSVVDPSGEAAPVEPTVVEPAPAPEPDRPKRSGWWQRAKASFGS